MLFLESLVRCDWLLLDNLRKVGDVVDLALCGSLFANLRGPICAQLFYGNIVKQAETGVLSGNTYNNCITYRAQPPKPCTMRHNARHL